MTDDAFAGYRPLPDDAHFTHRYWDAGAGDYRDDNLDFLTADELVWGPEGWTEREVGWLGPTAALRHQRILEVGCGLGQGTRYLTALGARCVGIDVAPGMVRAGRGLDAPDRPTPLLAADAAALPFAAGAFDTAFSAFGAVAFVADLAPVFAEIARVLSDGGRLVYSAPHPVRWMFSDDPADDEAPRIERSYFDSVPYLEGRRTAGGTAIDYAEFPHTLAAHVGGLTAAGFAIEWLREPRFKADVASTWAGWSARRAELFPGTLVVSARLVRGFPPRLADPDRDV